MNKYIFKKEICSYCKYNEKCSKDKIEYINYKKTNENKITIFKCNDFKNKNGVFIV